MRRMTALTVILYLFSAQLIAEDQLLRIDLPGELEGAANYPDRKYFPNSDDWVYGIDSSGLPVYKYSVFVSSGVKPKIKSITVQNISTNAALSKDELVYSGISTDAEGLVLDYPEAAIHMQEYNGIRAALELHFRDDSHDYYNLYISPFIEEHEKDELRMTGTISIDVESVYSNNSSSRPRLPGNAVMRGVISQLKAGNDSGISTRSSGVRVANDYSESPDYVIITNTELAPSFQDFILWKRALGYNVSIKLTEEIETEFPGLDPEEKIREYLEQAYIDGLEWVLLGGDETIVPVRKLYSANSDEPVDDAFLHPSDLYYADLTGDWDSDGDGIWGEPYHDNPDLQPELFAGRVPACTIQEVLNWTEKTIAYEKGEIVNMDGFTGEVMITSADQMRDWNEGLGQDSLIAEYFPDHIPVDRTSMAEYPSGQAVNPSQPPAQNFIQFYSQGWNIAIILAHGISGGFVSMSSGYNEWPKTYVWVGSGESADRGYLDNLENYGRCGIIYSVSCSQAAFDACNDSGRCFGEYILSLEDRGAAAFLGYTRYGWVASSYKLAEKFVEALYTADNRIGPANTISKLYHSNFRDLNYGLNILGDPSLLIWTRTPGSIAAEHPEIIAMGENDFTISVNADGQALEDARVTVISEDENLFYGYTDLDGLLDLAFNTGQDSGVVLTISKNGYIPYQAEIHTSIALDADDEEDDNNVPRIHELYQNYPNPANPTTTIGFYLPEQDDISLDIYNLLGQRIIRLEERSLDAGYHETQIDLSGYPSGVYMYRLKASEFSEVRKMVLLK